MHSVSWCCIFFFFLFYYLEQAGCQKWAWASLLSKHMLKIQEYYGKFMDLLGKRQWNNNPIQTSWEASLTATSKVNRSLFSCTKETAIWGGFTNAEREWQYLSELHIQYTYWITLTCVAYTTFCSVLFFCYLFFNSFAWRSQMYQILFMIFC